MLYKRKKENKKNLEFELIDIDIKKLCIKDLSTILAAHDVVKKMHNQKSKDIEVTSLIVRRNQEKFIYEIVIKKFIGKYFMIHKYPYNQEDMNNLIVNYTNPP